MALEKTSFVVGFTALIAAFVFYTYDGDSAHGGREGAEQTRKNSSRGLESGMVARKEGQAAAVVPATITTATQPTGEAGAIAPVAVLDEATRLTLAQAYRLGTDEQQRDFSKAFELYKGLADEQNALAEFNLAQLYELGEGVEQNTELAFSYYLKAAEQGIVEAALSSGDYYVLGTEEMPQDYTRAAFWYEKAVAKGSAIGLYNLGYLYEQGLGVSKDLTKAFGLYEKAAEQNMLQAVDRLAMFYEFGIATKRDPIKAVTLYQRAANEDLASSQASLGFMYEQGYGVKQDFETARFWYQKAANQNEYRAMTYLGYLYEQGLGVNKDNKMALKLYRKAANEDVPEAQNYLARFYELGIVKGKRDLVNAVKWYEKAATNGYTLAQYNLGRLYEAYDDIKDLKNAAAWYQKASTNGMEEAQNALKRLEKLNSSKKK